MTLETVKIGDQAPDFSLRDQNGRTVALSDLSGAPVLMVFFPFAFSRVCGGELGALRDEPALRSGGLQLLAISCDAMFSLRSMAEADKLDFPVLSDFWPHGQVAQAYGVLDTEAGCARRSSSLLDGDRHLRWTVHGSSGEPRSVESYLRAVRTLEADSDLPAAG